MWRSDQYKDTILAVIKKLKVIERAKSIKQLINEGQGWFSVCQTIANYNKKSMTITFFEGDALTYTYKLD